MIEFNKTKYIKSLKDKKLEMLVELINKEVNDKFVFIESMIKLSDKQMKLTRLYSLYEINQTNLKQYLKEKIEDEESNNIELNLKHPFVSLKNEDSQLFFEFINEIIESVLFDKFVKEINEKHIKIKKVKPFHLLVAANTNKVIIYEYCSNDLQKYAKGLNVLLIEDSKKIIKLNNDLSSNTIILDYSRNYTVANLVDLRILFGDDKYFPSDDEIKKLLLKYENINEIILPFYDDNSNSIVNHQGSGFSYFVRYYKLFKKLIELLKEVTKPGVKLYLPLDDIEDYHYWYVAIKSLWQSDVKVGMVLIDYQDIYIIDDLKPMDCCLIDFDEIVINAGYDQIDFEMFKKKFETIYRDIHNVLLENKIEHTIYSNDLNDEEIYEKFMIMGFRNFKHNYETYSFVEKSAQNFKERHGKYRKIKIK